MILFQLQRSLKRLLILLLLPLLLLMAGVRSSVEPQTSNASATVDGDLFLSVTSWHARTLTNVSWNIPAASQNASHLISFTWDEERTLSSWWEAGTNNVSRADSPPTSITTSSYLPSTSGDESPTCTFREAAFDFISQNAFNADRQRADDSVDLADGTTWWYIASMSQERPEATSPSSGLGRASVLLSEPGFYNACLLVIAGDNGGDDDECSAEECVDIAVYQPPYDFLEVSSTNIGNVITVGFNLASREAYSGDWGWVLGGVDPSLTLAEANSLSADEANDAFDERCWFYFGRAVELKQTFLCSSEPDPWLATYQSTPTLRAYPYGWFQLYLSAAGNESLWFGKHEQYTYTMMTHFYTCGVTVQPLNETTVTTTSDIVVTAVPEYGENCDVGDGIELSIYSGEVSANIEDVGAWIYFKGLSVNVSREETSLSIRLAYKGDHVILVSLASGAMLAKMNVTVIAADPYAPACEVTERPPSSSPEGSSVLVSFRARDYYDNWISDELSGGDSFYAWSYATAANTTAAADVFDLGNGSYTVVSDALDQAGGTTFLFVERDALGVPGSPFEVYVFGPASCDVVSNVGDCQPDLKRSVSQEWAANSPCLGQFDDPEHSSVACGSVPVSSGLGTTMVVTAAFAGLYAAAFLRWIRRNRRTVIVKLSQPFVCQLFLAGCILLNITASLHVEMALYAACVVRPWVMHIGLTFTSGCLYMKTYRVHRIFNNASKLSRVSITDRQLVSWVMNLVAVDVAFLIMWTVVDRPRKVDVVEVIGDIEVTNSECMERSDVPIFRSILWSWKACLNCFGVVMAAKTWHCEDGVGESQPICLCVYNTTLLGLVNLALQVFLSGNSNTVVGIGASAFTLIGGSVFAVSVLFGPKAYQLWMYGDLAANPAQRRGSTTMTAKMQSYARRGSTTSNAGSGRGSGSGGRGMLGRRRSSLTLNLNFMGAGKILPINEAKDEVEDGKVKGTMGGTRSMSISGNPISGGGGGGAAGRGRERGGGEGGGGGKGEAGA